MTVDKKIVNGEMVLTVAGCLDTAATESFAREVDAAIAEAKQLRFDFSKTEFICSSALRQLVSANKRLLANGGDMVIVGVSGVVREVLEITGLNGVFKIVDVG